MLLRAELPRPPETTAAVVIEAGTSDTATSPAELPRPLEAIGLLVPANEHGREPPARGGIVNDYGGVCMEPARSAQEVGWLLGRASVL